MKSKVIKDSIHGYIELEEPFWKIINTAEFQRLKWIEQTRVNALYPAARHDRFIHSLGTYHLGKKAFDRFYENVVTNLNQYNFHEINSKKEYYRHSFLLACLLHDVGHAPFSHTCEDFFNFNYDVMSSDSIEATLLKAIEEWLEPDEYEVFKDDYDRLINHKYLHLKKPAPHEIMSSLVILRNIKLFCSCFLPSDNSVTGSTDTKKLIMSTLSIDLIVRSILGCVYDSSLTAHNYGRDFKNCLIRLLNSKTIDVDKLDYIVRDATMSGYKTISIDEERLLNNLDCVNIDDGKVTSYRTVAFRKSAMSVVDNVMVARNAEYKWLVNHPATIYDNYLIRTSILLSVLQLSRDVGRSFSDIFRAIFSLEALSRNGKEITQDYSINLLSDSDIMCLIKRAYFKLPTHSEEWRVINEFLDRGSRKSPIWKSHEEYHYYVETYENHKCIVKLFEPLFTHIRASIRDSAVTKLPDEYAYMSNEYTYIHINNELLRYVESLDKKDYDDLDALLNPLKCLNQYCKSVNNNGTTCEFDFIIIPIRSLLLGKPDPSNVYLKFGSDEREYILYSKLSQLGKHRIYESNQDEDEQIIRDTFYYMYSKSKIGCVREFIRSLIRGHGA